MSDFNVNNKREKWVKTPFKSIKRTTFYTVLKVTFISLTLNACVSNPASEKPAYSNKPQAAPNNSTSTNKFKAPLIQSSYLCHNPQNYINQVVGNGHCVSFIKQCSNAPFTGLWQAGEKVLSLASNSIKPGSIIATFKNGKYPNISGYHAAIYISHDENGIWVWDQWVGKTVHKRLIRKRSDKASASNTAQAYRLVK